MYISIHSYRNRKVKEEKNKRVRVSVVHNFLSRLFSIIPHCGRAPTGTSVYSTHSLSYDTGFVYT